MSKSYNRTIIIGRLGANPIKKDGRAWFPIGNSIVNRDGNVENQWHEVHASGKQAELVMKYLGKGDLCCIEGRLEPENFAISAERITFLSHHRGGQNA